jgi:hypothetical protein
MTHDSIEFRSWVLSRLDPFSDIDYIDAHSSTRRCPLCHGGMTVRFTPVAVHFNCCGEWCDERDIAAAVFNVDRETDAVVDAHRDRLVTLLTAPLEDPAWLEANTSDEEREAA